MTPEILKQLEDKFKEVVDSAMEEQLKTVVGPLVAAETKNIVQQMRMERALFGMDRSGLGDEEKKNFAEIVKAAAFGKTKANEALIEEQDSRGGYLVPKEVAAAIVRIAASVGLIMSQAQKWPMSTDELGIPNYTGSFLEGEYLGVDAAGTVSALAFGQAKLVVKKWQLAFVVGNDLMADSPVALADWLLALGGEALANNIDKQGFAGAGTPFVGILNNDDVTVQTMASGKDTFAEFDLDEASDAIANVEESVLDGSAFYMNRTVWAKLRVKKDTNGTYIFGYPNSVGISFDKSTYGGLRPAGFILDYPVFTSRHFPLNSATAVSTKFAIFGNMKALAYGDKGEMRVAQHASGAFGGKEIALADQTGLVYKHRHALTVSLPAAFVNIKTAAN
jgi:HK97 family phage major capsid protein